MMGLFTEFELRARSDRGVPLQNSAGTSLNERVAAGITIQGNNDSAWLLRARGAPHGGEGRGDGNRENPLQSRNSNWDFCSEENFLERTSWRVTIQRGYCARGEHPVTARGG